MPTLLHGPVAESAPKISVSEPLLPSVQTTYAIFDESIAIAGPVWLYWSTVMGVEDQVIPLASLAEVATQISLFPAWSSSQTTYALPVPSMTIAGDIWSLSLFGSLSLTLTGLDQFVTSTDVETNISHLPLGPSPCQTT